MPGATSSCPSGVIVDDRNPGLLPQFPGSPVSLGSSLGLIPRGSALGKLPTPQAERVTELLDQPEPVPVSGLPSLAITSA